VKKLAAGLLGLIVILVAAVLIGPSFVDWNSQKGRIAAEVERLTGRKLTIDGDLSLVILPAPAFSAAQVRFANIEGGSAPTMIELESLDVRVSLIPLIQGRVEVERIDLVKPTILVEVLPDGRANWEIAGPDQAAPATRPGRPGDRSSDFLEQVRLHSVRISDGTLIYRDAVAAREERITGLNAEIAAGSLNGPFAVTGDVVVHGIKTAFDVAVGQLVAQGATSLNVKLDLPGAGAKARFGGAVSRHPDGASLRGKLKAEGGSLAAVVALLAGGGVVSRILAQPFEAETELSLDLQQATASELSFRLGDTAIEGEVRIDFSAPLDVRINLSASRFNLDKLLAAGASAATIEPSGEGDGQSDGQSGDQAGEQAASDSGPVLPADVTATAELTIDAVIYRRQVVRQVLVSLSLANGQLRVSQALALLPGGSDISITGVAAQAKAAGGPELQFTGRIEAASDNLRGMLQWLGVDIASVPQGRLRRMSLSAKVAASASQATVSDIDLRVDVSRATGGIAVALRERPGFGIGFAVDKLDLDAYLPTESVAAQEGQAGQGPAAEPASGEGPLAALASFDANLDLSLGSLTLRGVTARKLKLDATLQGGAMSLREVTIGDLAGSEVRLSGTLSDLAATPSIVAEVALSVPKPGKLAKLAGQDPAVLARIGAFEVTGTVRGTLARVGLDAELTALGGRFGVAGTVQPLASPMGFDLKLVAKHPDLAKLARALDVGPALGPSLGGVDLTLGLRGTPARIEVAGLAGNLGPATLTGGFAADLSGPVPVLSGIDLGVGVRHADLGGLIEALSPGAEVRQGLGAVDLKGRVTGGAQTFQIADLAGRLGPAEISGRLGADLSGTKPALDIELTTGELPLAALMAAGGGGASSGTVSGGREDRWSREPIDVSGLNAVNAEVKLNAEALLLENARIDRVAVEASLVDGLLDLRKFNGTIYDGALAITGKVDARKTLEAGLAVTAIDLDLARLLHDLAQSDRVSGPLSFSASLSTRGRSEAELVSALAGNGKVDGSLKVTTKQEERAAGQLLGLAGALLGQKVKEFDQVRGLADATNVLFNAFADAPAAISGSFTVARGVIVTDDLRVDGRQAVARTQGRADLPNWLLDSETGVYLAEDPNRPYITIGLRGPLDAPNPRLSGVPLAPQQQPAPQLTPQPDPQPDPQPAKPEDLLMQGLEKGLKSLFGN
jgi:hypothetical protein